MDKKEEFTIRPHLKTLSLVPENQEMPIHFLKKWAIADRYFFRRNHFPYPLLPKESFLLSINGTGVKRSLVFHYKDILSMPSRSHLVTLECSGNKRKKFKPRVYGEQWGDGAISQGWWKGVSLKYLLNITGLHSTAKEVVFEGFDHGKRTDMEGDISFIRSLPLEEALHPDVIIAYEYNNKTIPYKHGFPIRLIVPNWYAMASVKWLKRITVIDYHYEGPFQTFDYMYKPKNGTPYPVTFKNVNSTIQKPLNYDQLDTGTHLVEGLAWTGLGTISLVEISTDNGNTWNSTKLKKNPNQPYSWTTWNYQWNVKEKGEYLIMSRAYDTYGRKQPLESIWNEKGYGYNSINKIHVIVK